MAERPTQRFTSSAIVQIRNREGVTIGTVSVGIDSKDGEMSDRQRAVFDRLRESLGRVIPVYVVDESEGSSGHGMGTDR